MSYACNKLQLYFSSKVVFVSLLSFLINAQKHNRAIFCVMLTWPILALICQIIHSALFKNFPSFLNVCKRMWQDPKTWFSEKMLISTRCNLEWYTYTEDTETFQYHTIVWDLATLIIMLVFHYFAYFLFFLLEHFFLHCISPGTILRMYSNISSVVKIFL